MSEEWVGTKKKNKIKTKTFLSRFFFFFPLSFLFFKIYFILFYFAFQNSLTRLPRQQAQRNEKHEKCQRKRNWVMSNILLDLERFKSKLINTYEVLSLLKTILIHSQDIISLPYFYQYFLTKIISESQNSDKSIIFRTWTNSDRWIKLCNIRTTGILFVQLKRVGVRTECSEVWYDYWR